MKINLSQRQRRDRVYDSVRMGYSARRIAQYLEVSETTVRRDVAAMPSLREESASWPDAYRHRSGDRGVTL